MWFSRFLSTLLLSRTSSHYWATGRTLCVSLIAAPLLEIIASVFLGKALGAPLLDAVACRFILLGTVIISASTFTLSVVTDNTNGILPQVLTYRRFDTAYWCAHSTLSAFSGVLSGLVSIGALMLCFTPFSPIMTRACLLLPCTAVAGCALGFLCATCAPLTQDPFLLLNTFIAMLPLSTGALVPLHSYPVPLSALFMYFPFSHLISSIEAPQSDLFSYIFFEVVVSLVNCVLALFALYALRQKIRQGSHKKA
ncbi:ABC transporter permease [Schaalia sp. lx-100]|uniref:ABC transporter permease n=1 Tax=Schaalia sp. lx-100 TaxID=2899081 RepID=UPI001E652FFA|nr:ABC transporter permease [Schaalia sp. lx-100]MCD4557025.1 ABC transporter permease [Schaalia sp. lx-100]